jgi:hypothetical protein
VNLLNNRLKAPYSDQFSIGMRNRVGDWNTSATLARILSHNGFAYTLGNRLPDGTFFQNGNPPFNYPIPRFGTLILGNNGIETRSTQVLVSIEKPYTDESRWGMISPIRLPTRSRIATSSSTTRWMSRPSHSIRSSPRTRRLNIGS